MDESILWSTQKESQFFERKSAWSRSGRRKSPRKIESVIVDILDVLSAMTHADGGELVIGIEDDGLATGVPHSGAQLHDMCEAPGDERWVSPALTFGAEPVDLHEGDRVLHFFVKPACQVHVLADGRRLLRIRDANVPLSDRQVAGLEKTMQQRVVERAEVTHARLSDLDFDLISQFFPHCDIKEKLLELDLVVTHRGQLVPRFIALLLFGYAPQKWHPYHGVAFHKFDAEGDVVLKHAFSHPLATLPQHVFDFVRTHIPKQERFPMGSVPIYPEKVWREAIVNAILHRDYGLRTCQIEIFLYPDRMEICSPGLPPRPITANRLNRVRGFHLSRNPILYRAWADMGGVVDVGMGAVFMRQDMARAGLAAAHFDRYDGRMLRVTLHHRSIYNEMLLAWLARFKNFDLSDDDQRVLAYARLHGYQFAVGQYAKLTDQSLFAATEAVEVLVRKGLIRVLKRDSDHYRVLEPLFVPSDMASFLIPRLETKGWLANRHVRRGLGVRRQTARRLLRLWCDENWIVKRGKSAQTVYVSGPRFQKQQKQM